MWKELNERGAAFVPQGMGGIDHERGIAVELLDVCTPSGRQDMRRRQTSYAEGVRLISVFSHEWRDRREQVSDFVLSALGIFRERLHGRKCKTAVLEWGAARGFLDAYHIQGAGRHDIALGLIHADRLVGVMAFGQHHRQGQYTPILTRLCFAPGVQVVGGASKLFRAAVENCGFRHLLSWADNRLSAGRVYHAMGFAKTDELPPDYFYANVAGEARSKQSMKKSNTGCPPDITEKRWSRDNGWHQIFDAGKTRFEWRGRRT